MKQIFLISLLAKLPPDMPADVFEPLAARETERVRELHSSGVIERIWRQPGKRASISIWRTESADELHDALASLPLYPWMEIDVRPLATHYLEHNRES